MAPKVLFYVQHLLGIGHVVRAGRIVRGLLRAGFVVCVANGGKPVDGIDWGEAHVAQLPAVEAAPGGFSQLVTARGDLVDDAFKARRQEGLLALFSKFKPDILLIEAYPFARRIMRFELKPLLEATHMSSPRPVVVSSIRDLLQEGRKPERIEETTSLVQNWFDAVLVHGDPDFAPLAMSYPDADKISDKLHYTGFVGPEAAPPSAEMFDVIVSAGGGAVGGALFQAALDAQPDCSLKDARWLFLAGPNLADASYARLRTEMPSNVTRERFRSDVPSLLRTAKLSISQAGYNTMADVLASRCCSVVVPFARDGETEQTRRAELLEARGYTIALPETELSGQNLARAIDSALERPPPPPDVALNGADQTARVLKRLLSSSVYG